VVLMESVTDLRMTSDEAPLRRGGGMQYAPLALPRRRLLFPVLAVGGLLLLAVLAPGVRAQSPPAGAVADSVSAPRKIESGPKKQPVVAFGLSLFVPGVGQFYNGQPGKGAIFLGGYLTGWGLMIAGAVKTYTQGTSNNGGNSLFWAGIVVGGVSWVGSVIDAPASARNINHRRGYSSLNAPGVGLMFVPDPRNPRRLQPGVGLQAGF